MGLATVSEIINIGNFGTGLDAAKLNPHMLAAENEIRGLLGDTLYDAIPLYPVSTETDAVKATQTRTKKICTLAENNLVVSYAIHSLNIDTQGSGIVRSKGWDQSRSDLLSQNEANGLSAHFREVAMNLLAPYIPEAEIAEDDEDGNPNEIDLGSIYMGAI